MVGKDPNKSNPIKNDPLLKELMGQAKEFSSEADFKGWRTSFLDAYTTYLDDIGRENAHVSEAHVLRTIKKLSQTVIKVYGFTMDGAISKEKTSVKGQRALTDMTDQMAGCEKELQRFLPSTQQDEERVGYNKFELGAVLIADGFEVYEILKSIKDIVLTMKDVTLQNVCSSNSISVVNFFIRQIDSFADVMADLGLLKLMENVVAMYEVKPRAKKSSGISPKSSPKPAAKPKVKPKTKPVTPKAKPAPAANPKPKTKDSSPKTSPDQDPKPKVKANPKPKTKNIVYKPKKRTKSTDSNDPKDLASEEAPSQPPSDEESPKQQSPKQAKPDSPKEEPEKPKKKKNVKTRAIIDNGYVNPLLGGGPSKGPNNKKGDASPDAANSKPKSKSKNNPQDDNNSNSGGGGGGGNGKPEEIIYFDLKTGRIGKILRSTVMDQGLIITKDDNGKEKLDGEVEDEQAREDLIWAMKKAMKKKKSMPGKKK